MQPTIFPLKAPLPPDDIVDREEFLASLERRLQEQYSLMLPAPRRMGKTAVAHEVLRRLREGRRAITAEVDLFTCQGPREFAVKLMAALLRSRDRRFAEAARTGTERLLAAMLSSVEVAAQIGGLDLHVRGRPQEMSDTELLDQALELPGRLAERDGRLVVVLLDEFQEAPRIGGEGLLKRMRATWQRQSGVAYVFLGSRTGMLRSLFGQRRQALYRFADVLEVPPVPVEAWAAYIGRKLAGRGMTIEPAALDFILAATGGHPYDTMKVCSAAYFAAAEARAELIDMDLAVGATRRAVDELAALFDQELAELDSRRQARSILIRLARGEGPYIPGVNPSTCKRALDHLRGQGRIERIDRGRYAFVEPLLAQYLREA